MSALEIAWTAVGVVVAIAITLGFAAIGLNPPEFKVARGCFGFSACLLGGMTAVWSVQTNHSWGWRFVICGLIGATIGIFLPEGIRFIVRRELPVAPESLVENPLDNHSPGPSAAPRSPLESHPVKDSVNAVVRPHELTDQAQAVISRANFAPNVSLTPQEGYPLTLLNKDGQTIDAGVILNHRRYYIFAIQNKTDKEIERIELNFQLPYPIDEVKITLNKFSSDVAFDPSGMTMDVSGSGSVHINGRQVTGNYQLLIGKMQADGEVDVLFALNSSNYQLGTHLGPARSSPELTYIDGTFVLGDGPKVIFYRPLQLSGEDLQLGDPVGRPKLRQSKGWEVVPF